MSKGDGASTSAQKVFDRLAASHLREPGVTLEPVFHNDALKVDAKLYAFITKGQLVVKVPSASAAKLTESGRAAAYEPSPGRRMREWIALDPPRSRGDQTWARLMADARRYVASLPATTRSRRKRP
jgi:hypothetical protein